MLFLWLILLSTSPLLTSYSWGIWYKFWKFNFSYLLKCFYSLFFNYLDYSFFWDSLLETYVPSSREKEFSSSSILMSGEFSISLCWRAYANLASYFISSSLFLLLSCLIKELFVDNWNVRSSVTRLTK